MSPGLRAATLAISLAVAPAGCVTIGDAEKPIATILVPALEPGPEAEAIVVLPGFGADAQALRDHGVDQAIHRAWPQADVVLTSATFAYYQQRVVAQRLRTDVIEPARKRYRKLWLAGASIGGMGALLYERMHPGEMDGLVLFAPWLGSDELLNEVRAAGGVRRWDPGPPAGEIDGDNYQREIWRVIKGWSQNPGDAQRVWLVCGTDDRLLEAGRLLATAIPASHYLEIAGGHTWEAWITSAEQVIARIRGQPGA